VIPDAPVRTPAPPFGRAAIVRPPPGLGFRMLFVLIGVILIACNLLDVGPMAAWTWDLTGDVWKLALPFGLAIVWWIWSDASGWTKKKAMQRDADRKQDRHDRNIDAMGLGYLHKHRDGKKRSKH